MYHTASAVIRVRVHLHAHDHIRVRVLHVTDMP